MAGLFSGAPRDELGRTLKVKQWLLLSARENLEHRHKPLLNELMEQNKPLYQAYLLKEQVRGSLQYPWRYFGVLANACRSGSSPPSNPGCTN